MSKQKKITNSDEMISQLEGLFKNFAPDTPQDEFRVVDWLGWKRTELSEKMRIRRTRELETETWRTCMGW
jgi:hypothetical protein